MLKKRYVKGRFGCYTELVGILTIKLSAFAMLTATLVLRQPGLLSEVCK